MPRKHGTLIPRKASTLAPPARVCSAALAEFRGLLNFSAKNVKTIAGLRERYAGACSAYYALAALTRRREKAVEHHEALSLLFPMRSRIERAMLNDLQASFSADEILKQAFGGAFFGASAKQGVSIRYALASCIPTLSCGGLCYAHDGRDRELNHLLRGVLNWCVGVVFEEGGADTRRRVMKMIEPVVAKGICLARREVGVAEMGGVMRAPRIRFAHVGEMAATPEFANALAAEIHRQDPEVICVVYTRHPNANLLSPEEFVINFTLESDEDSRSRFVPGGARVVGSAWDGSFVKRAAINFLEHHVEKKSNEPLFLTACPVTVAAKNVHSCDAAKCERCFRVVGEIE